MIVFVIVTALVLAAIRIGGGLYECLLVDRVWPGTPALIQPERGGINRKLFWMPVHLAFELTLMIAIWLAWSEDVIRTWLLVAAASHVLMRGWSAAYFIPRAIEFERAGDWTPDLRARATTWVRLSVWRLPLDLVTLFAVWAAVIAAVSS
ncbi:hypothetical protein GDR74_12095 [Microvirga thermotolerans]|uniref:DUF1772 domain-containing protein n=2 Tax=Microvirga thermotolerans TaxID=2651334 RepID=A0A5P9K238_9HYPH|nr:hypothetical protein GDR74_12095 [Microvirga thermotolerans]